MAIDTTEVHRPGAAHVESYWAATGGAEVDGCDPVAADLDTDIAIIGGGYTGLSCAYHLGREHRAKPHLLEAHRVGWGCSGRNGGFCSIGIGKHDFGDWVSRYGLDQAKSTYQIGQASVETVRGIIAGNAIDCDQTPDGGLELAHKPNRFPQMTASARRMNEMFGANSEALSKADLDAHYLSSREAYGAILHKDGFSIHALKYARGLARAALAHGAVIHNESPVLDWRRDGTRHLLKTPRGTVRARQVVIATNGYTADRLHPWSAGRLLPVLSNIIVTRPLSEAERQAVNWMTHHKIWDSRRLLFYYRLLPDNRILFGARGGIHDDAGEHNYRRAWLERRLGEMFPPLTGIGSDYFWYGWVCASYDKNPHAGTTDDPTVHYALAYMGTGVALATHCGKLLADRLAGAPPAIYGALLQEPLPRFPLPALRRLYQRIAYTKFSIQDEWL